MWLLRQLPAGLPLPDLRSAAAHHVPVQEAFPVLLLDPLPVPVPAQLAAALPDTPYPEALPHHAAATSPIGDQATTPSADMTPTAGLSAAAGAVPAAPAAGVPAATPAETTVPAAQALPAAALRTAAPRTAVAVRRTAAIPEADRPTLPAVLPTLHPAARIPQAAADKTSRT